MQRDGSWVRATLNQIQRKKKMQQTLREKLAAWNTGCDLADIPSAKRTLLEKLSLESTATIQALIDRIESDIQALFTSLREANG